MQLYSVSLHAGAQGRLTAAPGLSPGKPVPHGLMKSSSEGLVVGGLPLRPPPQHIQDPLKFIIRFIFLFPPLDLSPWQQFSQLHFISFSANLFLFPPQFSLSFLILCGSAHLPVSVSTGPSVQISFSGLIPISPSVSKTVATSWGLLVRQELVPLWGSGQRRDPSGFWEVCCSDVWVERGYFKP